MLRLSHPRNDGDTYFASRLPPSSIFHILLFIFLVAIFYLRISISSLKL